MKQKISVIAFITAVLCVPSQSFAQQTQPSFARELSASCIGCHAPDDQKDYSIISSLAGIPESTMIEHLRQFKQRERPATIMHQIAAGYTMEELSRIAHYLSQISSSETAEEK